MADLNRRELLARVGGTVAAGGMTDRAMLKDSLSKLRVTYVPRNPNDCSAPGHPGVRTPPGGPEPS